jgi:hypothetical protein
MIASTYATGCPPNDGFILHVTPKAMAYEVSAGDKEWIVPDLSRDYEVEDGHGVIVTGTMGCEDFAIPEVRPFEISFTPLFTDGSEGFLYSPGCRWISHQRSAKNVQGGGAVEGGMVECSSSRSLEFSGRVKRLPY